MSLISYDDVAKRYPEVAKGKDATEVNSTFIQYAEAEVYEKLSPYFTIPFSSNNLTGIDLIVDLAFAKMYRWKDSKKAEAVETFVAMRIDRLINGQASMITASNDVIQSIGETVYSTTKTYHPVHGMSPTEYSIVDSGEIRDEEDARGHRA